MTGRHRATRRQLRIDGRSPRFGWSLPRPRTALTLLCVAMVAVVAGCTGHTAPAPLPKPRAPITTVWADVSKYQVVVDDSYTRPVLEYRINDGQLIDAHASANNAWCQSRAAAGLIAACIAYYVYRPGIDSVDTLKSVIGTPFPRLVVMIDVESWSGQITGNHSADINAERSLIASWIGAGTRVIGYGNAGDLASIWPTRLDAQVIAAAYGRTVSVPGQLAQQYTDGQYAYQGLPTSSAPFGRADHDVFYGTPAQLAAKLGVPGTSPVTTGPVISPPLAPSVPTPAPAPKTPALPPAVITVTYTVRKGDTLTRIAGLEHTTVAAIVARNHIANPNRIYVGERLIIAGAVASAPPAVITVNYVVRKGDTLSRIAGLEHTTVAAIVARNHIANPNRIYVGERLTV